MRCVHKNVSMQKTILLSVEMWCLYVHTAVEAIYFLHLLRHAYLTTTKCATWYLRVSLHSLLASVDRAHRVNAHCPCLKF